MILSKIRFFCPIISLNIPLITFTAFFDSCLSVYVYTIAMYPFTRRIISAQLLHNYKSDILLIILSV